VIFFGYFFCSDKKSDLPKARCARRAKKAGPQAHSAKQPLPGRAKTPFAQGDSPPEGKKQK